MKKIIAVLMAMAMILTMFAACSKTEEDPIAEISDYDKVAVKIGGMEYTVNDYNYTYVATFSDVYSHYGNYIDMKTPLSEQDMGDGTSWHDYFCSYTEDNLKSLTALYEKANAEGYEISESGKESIANLRADIEASAAEYNMEFDKYIEAMYGKGMTYDCIAKMIEIGTNALRIIAVHFLIAWFCTVVGTVFQALGKAIYSMIVSVMRQLLFYAKITLYKDCFKEVML